MTQMFQTLACTSIEAMAYSRFNPNNLDTILGMIRDNPTAAYQILASNSQLKSLEDTYQSIKVNLNQGDAAEDSRWRGIMLKLAEVVKEMSKQV